MSGTMTAPFEVTGMTPEEQEDHDLYVERSIGNLTKQMVEEGPSTELLKVFLNWLKIQDEEYGYSESIIERELYLRGEL